MISNIQMVVLCMEHLARYITNVSRHVGKYSMQGACKILTNLEDTLKWHDVLLFLYMKW